MQARYIGIGVVIAGALIVSTLMDSQPANDRSGSLDSQETEPLVAPPKPLPLESLPPKVRYRTSSPGIVPPALEGTHIDGSLLADENGDLVINRELRRLFDYFMLASAGEPLEDTLNRLRNHIDNRLKGNARIQARELLEQYIDYKTRLFDLETRTLEMAQSGADPVERLAAHFEALAQIRRESLPPDAVEAFFRDEENYDQFILNRYRITANKNLSEADQRSQLEALEASLPPNLQETLRGSYAHQQLSRETHALRANGADETAIRDLRVAAIGIEGTERLEKLDQERDAWQARLTQYRAEREQILAGGSLQGEDLEQALNALRERHFSGREILRVEALDRISGQ